MVNDVHEQGVIEDSEAKMINNIFAFADKEVGEIMTNRSNIVSIDKGETLEHAIKFMLDNSNSRYPVYEEKITDIADIEPDTKVNIIARIIRIPTIRSYEKNGKEGKVASLELQDDSGQIS